MVDNPRWTAAGRTCRRVRAGRTTAKLAGPSQPARGAGRDDDGRRDRAAPARGTVPDRDGSAAKGGDAPVPGRRHPPAPGGAGLGRVTGEVGAGAALAGGQGRGELRADLAGVVRQAGREFHDTVRLATVTAAGSGALH